MSKIRSMFLLVLLVAGSSLFAQNGSINFTSPSPYGTSGVLLKSESSWPNISAKLGDAASSSSFTVFDSADLPLFSVRGDGSVLLQKNQNAETVLSLTNNSTGASARNAIRLMEGSTTRAILSANNSGYAGGYANWVSLNAVGNGNLSFGTNNIERMRIYGDGSVAIQTYGTDVVGPYNARFFVQDGKDNSKAIFVSHQPNFAVADPSQVDYGIFVQAQESVLTGATNAGIMNGIYANATLINAGTLSNANGGVFQVGTMQAAGTGTVTNATALRTKVLPEVAGSIVNGYGLYIEDVISTNDYGVYQAGASDDNYFAGNVGIGTAAPQYKLHVVGNVRFDGTVTGNNIQAHYQDVAEWVPATHDLAPGTVVILNPNKNNEVMPSGSPYDTTVAGVVSAQPGLSLGVGGEGKEQIATTGRVKVRVDARKGAIHVGDLLVTSDIPGTAMRSEPMEINGRKFHQPGTILGKALEPLNDGTGEILVLLSMQ